MAVSDRLQDIWTQFVDELFDALEGDEDPLDGEGGLDAEHDLWTDKKEKPDETEPTTPATRGVQVFRHGTAQDGSFHGEYKILYPDAAEWFIRDGFLSIIDIDGKSISHYPPGEWINVRYADVKNTY